MRNPVVAVLLIVAILVFGFAAPVGSAPADQNPFWAEAPSIEVTVYGEINSASAHDTITAIQYANRQKTDAPIKMYIDCPGGSIAAGGKIIDAMAASRRPIWTVNVGVAASMGAEIFTYGQKRLMLPHSMLMFHDAHANFEGSPRQLGVQIAVFTRVVTEYEQHLAAIAGISLQEVREHESQTWYLLADDAIAAHIATGKINSDSYPAPK